MYAPKFRVRRAVLLLRASENAPSSYPMDDVRASDMGMAGL